jgi:hypothetical protein
MVSPRRPPRQGLSHKMRRGLTPPVLSERTLPTRSVGGLCRPSCRSMLPTRHAGGLRRLSCQSAHRTLRQGGGRRKDTPNIICRANGAHVKGRRAADPGNPPLSTSYLSLSLSVTRVSDTCPLAYKREGEDPRRGTELSDTHALA